MRSTSPTPGKQHRVEQRGEIACDRAGRAGHAVDLARGDELREALVQLVHHEAVEADRVVQEPVKGVDGQARHHASAQRLDVVAVDLALEHRAFAEPAPWRQPLKVMVWPCSFSLLILSRPSITPNQ
jgi:hypothetical protein